MEKSELMKLLKRQKTYVRLVNNFSQELNLINSQILEELIKCPDENKKSKTINEEYLTPKEVCKMLKISPSTLYRMRRDNKIPCTKFEGRKNVHFSKKEIINFMEQNKLD